jgi:hypothetical protein
MLVRVNNLIYTASVSSYFTVAPDVLNYTIDTERTAPYSAGIDQITVTVNGKLLRLGADYTVDLAGITITLTKSDTIAYDTQTMAVNISTPSQYTYLPIENSIQFASGSIPPAGSTVEVITNYDHTYLDLERTEITVSGLITTNVGTTSYYEYNAVGGGFITLDRLVLNGDYVWVVQDKLLLTPNVDYVLLDDHKTVKLATIPENGSKFTLITFGSNVLTTGISYMQFKDMLNRTVYKRLSQSKQTVLTQDLSYKDTVIHVLDASYLDVPSISQQIPGVIEIRGERIEYWIKDGNTLRQLRRGTLGTGIYDLNKSGTVVQGIGASDTIPYADKTIKEEIISDGVSQEIPLQFVPSLKTDSVKLWLKEYGFIYKDMYTLSAMYSVNDIVIYNDAYYYCINLVPEIKSRKSKVDYSPSNIEYWTLAKLNIPVGYGQCDSMEVFVGGYRDTAIWEANTTYAVGAIVNVGSYTYKCTQSHLGGTTFFATVSLITDNSTKDYTDVWQFFVGNIRLKKQPYKVHNVNIAPYSPAGDVQLDADFSVNGALPVLYLTNKLAAGTKITVIRRTLTFWDSLTNIHLETNKIAEFLRATPGISYTGYKK